MGFTFPKNIGDTSIESLGGKGYNLYKLSKITTIPKTIVIPSQIYEEFIVKNHIDKKIESIVKNINIEDYHSLDDASEKIRKLILDAKEFPIDTKKLNDVIQPFKRVSVRSSSNYEDLATASFAGQHESYLNVRIEDIEDKIRRVWSSLYTPRALMYRELKNIPHDKVKMAVVIQEMINSSISGVVFTKNPLTGNNDEMVIEAVYGLGEGIVSGKITPDNYIINKTKKEIISKQISQKTIKVVSNENGGIDEIKIDDESETLSSEQLKALIEESLKIEKYFGKAQDIEWAIDENNKLWILQSRDITV